MRLSRRNRWFVGIIAFAVIGTGIGFVLAQTASPPENPLAKGAIGNNHEVLTNDAGLRYIVDPALLMAGGPQRDGIPSIDHPTYVSLDEADEWIADNELMPMIWP